jgi:hypothetical protein
MTHGIFRDKNDVPTVAKLKRVLGEAFPLFAGLERETAGFAHEWKHYGKIYGWQYKISDSKKALLYAAPSENEFLVVFGVREKERDALLAAKLPVKYRDAVESAKKHPEGYAVRILVSNTAAMRAVKIILGVLKEARGSP